MSEPSSNKPVIKQNNKRTPKPFSTVGYLVWTTLWATLFPALYLTALITLLACLTPAIIVAMPIFALIVILYYPFGRLGKRLSYNLRTGNVPNSFRLQIQPFFMPLFYTLLVTATAFYFCAAESGAFPAFVIIVLPHYFFWTMMNAAASNAFPYQELITALPCGLAFLVAVFETIYISIVSRSPQNLLSRLKILSVMFGITLFLCGLVALAYWHFRTEVLIRI